MPGLLCNVDGTVVAATARPPGGRVGGGASLVQRGPEGAVVGDVHEAVLLAKHSHPNALGGTSPFRGHRLSVHSATTNCWACWVPI